MSGQWKPGDPEFAVISWQSKSGRSGGTQIAMRVADSYTESHWQSVSFGSIDDEAVTDARPLLVIDPEDREAVERLRDLWDDAHEEQVGHRPSQSAKGARGNCLQAALRALATSKPPEPQGLGAVVRDADDALWVRCSKRFRQCVGDNRGRFLDYSSIDAVEVLSEGVQS